MALQVPFLSCHGPRVFSTRLNCPCQHPWLCPAFSMAAVGQTYTQISTKLDTTMSSSLFLQLPIDLVVQLCSDYLSPWSAMAVSVTCKNLFGLLFLNTKQRLNRRAVRKFLRLVERDTAHFRYYCDACWSLHRFEPSDGPTAHDFASALDKKDCRRHRFYCWGSGFTIGHHHIRLAINRHRFGSPNGLPLDRFTLNFTSLSRLGWKETWSARIVGNEFFLSGVRELSWNGTEQDLRDAIDKTLYSICGHVETVKHATYPVAALHPDPDFLSTGHSLLPCREAVESCPQCVTDYATTVERRIADTPFGEQDTVSAGRWAITITSYHRLGYGDSLSDRMWLAFMGPTFQEELSTKYGPLHAKANAHSFPRDKKMHPQGSVKALWERGGQGLF